MEGWHCLGCGTMFWMASGTNPICCPHCHDRFLSGGLLEGVPQFVGESYVIQNKDCGHVIEMDFPGDVAWCSVCGMGYSEKHSSKEPTLKRYQQQILKSLGMR
jgi:hypothetical protein